MIIHSYTVPLGQPGGGDIIEYDVAPFFDPNTPFILQGYCFTTIKNHTIKVSEKILSKTLIEAFPDLIIEALHEMAKERIRKRRMLL